MYKLKTIIRPLNILLVLIFTIVNIACSTDDSSRKIIRTISKGDTQKLVHHITYEPNNLLSAMSVFDDELYYVSERILSRTKVDSGEIIWKSSGNSSEFWGTISITATESFIYILTSTHLVAVDKLVGSILWSTELGSGHVRANQQIVGDNILIYYGDKLFYIDKVTGSINNQIQDSKILWRNNNIEIRINDFKGMEGYDLNSNSQIWKNNDKPFRVDHYFFPVVISESENVVRTSELEICSMDILSGKYLWCRGESYLSNVDFDSSRNMLYALRDDYALVAIDIVTGNIVDELIFEPLELPQELQQYIFDYFVEVSSNRIVIYFGDSNQFFVFTQTP